MFVLEGEDAAAIISRVAVVFATEEDLAAFGVFETEAGAEDLLKDFDFARWKPQRPPGLWQGPVTYMSRDEDEHPVPVALWLAIPEAR